MPLVCNAQTQQIYRGAPEKMRSAENVILFSAMDSVATFWALPSNIHSLHSVFIWTPHQAALATLSFDGSLLDLLQFR
jgi:hypothetical protein